MIRLFLKVVLIKVKLIVIGNNILLMLLIGLILWNLFLWCMSLIVDIKCLLFELSVINIGCFLLGIFNK